jgi:hypothetical protein
MDHVRGITLSNMARGYSFLRIDNSLHGRIAAMLPKKFRRASAFVILVPVLGFTLLGINGSAVAQMPDGSAMDIAFKPSDLRRPIEPFYGGSDNARKEFAAARGDHDDIALQVSQCYAEMSDPTNWSPAARTLLRFDLDGNLMHVIPLGAGTAAGHLPALNAFHTAAIAFSDRISRDRLAFRRDLEDNRSRAGFYQFLVVALGALATIFVSVRAIARGDTRMAGFVGVAAIVLSACGTAVSSMNNFEGNAATALRDQRALSQLQQLHWRIASDLVRRHELCGPVNALSIKTMDDSMEVVNAWRSRLEAILDGAMDSISKPGDVTGGAARVEPTDKGSLDKQPPGDGANKPMTTAAQGPLR